MARTNRKTKVEVTEQQVEVATVEVPTLTLVESTVVESPVEQLEAPPAEVIIDVDTKEELEAVEAVATEAQQTPEYLIGFYGNKSKAIRALAAQGKSRSEIAKALNIRYQHVNNVLHQPLKREIKAEREAAKVVAEQATEAETETAE
jgi:hypothetical protein